MLEEGCQIVVSLAPSFPAAFVDLSSGQLVGALHELGLTVEETAVGVDAVAAEYHALYRSSQDTVISACCPVVVNLVEIYYPDLVPLLASVVSPMVAHCKMIKQRFPQAKTVFIGPCFAKKGEALRSSSKGAVDAVLSFDELPEVFARAGVDPSQCAQDRPDKMGAAFSQLYPLTSGAIRAARLDEWDSGTPLTPGTEDDHDTAVVSVTGIEQVRQLLEDIRKGLVRPRFVEAMACLGGCIMGPGIVNDLSRVARSSRVQRWHRQSREMNPAPAASERIDLDLSELHRYHRPRPFHQEMPSEETIREILAKTGKFRPEDETNCGGCGYATCREKAAAVALGLADVEMCIPYMKAKQESVSHVVFESTHNAIVVVDKDMVIQEFNPAANRLFNPDKRCTKGQPLQNFFDPSLCRQVWETQEMIYDRRVSYPELGRITRQTIYPLKEYGVVIAVITDITAEEKRRQEDDSIYDETLAKASEVIHNQMKIAQNIAGLLGESTAETKATLLELVALMQDRRRR